MYNQEREKRLDIMVQNELKQSEYKWTLFEDERTEILMEIGDYIFENMVEELSIEFL